jgi:hypothetical protein
MAAGIYAKGRLRAGRWSLFCDRSVRPVYAWILPKRVAHAAWMNLDKMTRDARLCEVFGVNSAMLPYSCT